MVIDFSFFGKSFSACVFRKENAALRMTQRRGPPKTRSEGEMSYEQPDFKMKKKLKLYRKWLLVYGSPGWVHIPKSLSANLDSLIFDAFFVSSFAFSQDILN